MEIIKMGMIIIIGILLVKYPKELADKLNENRINNGKSEFNENQLKKVRVISRVFGIIVTVLGLLNLTLLLAWSA